MSTRRVVHRPSQPERRSNLLTIQLLARIYGSLAMSAIFMFNSSQNAGCIARSPRSHCWKARREVCRVPAHQSWAAVIPRHSASCTSSRADLTISGVGEASTNHHKNEVQMKSKHTILSIKIVNVYSNLRFLYHEPAPIPSTYSMNLYKLKCPRLGRNQCITH